MTEAEAQVEATTEEAEKKSEGPDYDGVVKGKYNWDTNANTKRDADDDVKGAAITKYSWADGKKAVSIYVELEGLDDVADDALKAESGEKECSLTIDAIGKPPAKRVLRLAGLSNEIDGVKLVRKPGKNTVVLKLQKKEETTWYSLQEKSSSGGGGGSTKSSLPSSAVS